MSIIIHQKNATLFPFYLESPGKASQGFETLFYVSCLDIQFLTYSYGCQGVQDIMVTRYPNLDTAQGVILIEDLKTHL